MHEMSLVSSMLDIVEEYAARTAFRQVNSLKLSFGALSPIDPSALRTAFDVLSVQGPARGAGLELIIHPVKVRCLGCGQDSATGGYPCPCPRCGGDEVCVEGGFEDLRLEELDVD